MDDYGPYTQGDDFMAEPHEWPVSAVMLPGSNQRPYEAKCIPVPSCWRSTERPVHHHHHYDGTPAPMHDQEVPKVSNALAWLGLLGGTAWLSFRLWWRLRALRDQEAGR